ncbi:MAG TPA: T9SS type A sorting domain-containing protein [Edaphocola sp.]|nr:T9SS type A sorting domain-containing protein [Edaphocola sp.]
MASRLLANNNAYPFTNAAGNLSIYYAKNQGSMAIENHGSQRGYATLNMQAISVDTSTDIKDKIDESEVSVFPNPTQNNIFVKSMYAPVQRLVVYDLNGKKIFSSVQNNTIETSNLSKGNFVLEIILLNEKTIYKKFSKN